MSGETRAIRPGEYQAREDGANEPFGHYAPNAVQGALITLARATPLHRGSFRRMMTRTIMGGAGRPLDIEANGCRYRLHGTNNLIEYGLLLHPAYNQADIAFLLEEAAPGANFVDIGANIGLYTLPMARAAGQGGVVVAIDANPLMARRLAFNAAASELPQVRIFDCAVSDSETRGSLTIRKDDVAIVALKEEADGEIVVRTLASVVAECGLTAIHGLKIDIEGHEDKALVPFLAGAPAALLPRRIVIETAGPDGDYPGSVAEFARLGYRLAGRTKNNSLYRLDG